MEQKDIIELNDKQLKEAIELESMNATKLRLAHAVSPVENPMKLVQARKLIARLKTEQRARQIKAAAEKQK